jgi:hypothetical protein
LILVFSSFSHPPDTKQHRYKHWYNLLKCDFLNVKRLQDNFACHCAYHQNQHCPR